MESARLACYRGHMETFGGDLIQPHMRRAAHVKFRTEQLESQGLSLHRRTLQRWYLPAVFVWTYERSYDRYQAMRHTLWEPDTFRLRYREALINCVGEAIRQVGRGNAADTGEIISRLAKDQVPENDREHFLVRHIIENPMINAETIRIDAGLRMAAK